MGLTKNERAELHALAANVRDDRLRGLVFKLLGDTQPGHEEPEFSEQPKWDNPKKRETR